MLSKVLGNELDAMTQQLISSLLDENAEAVAKL